MQSLLDTSNFPSNHPTFSKLYALETTNQESKTRCKGVPSRGQQRLFQHYEECLMSKLPRLANFHTIRSRSHLVATEAVSKVALSAFDDKRYILEDGIHSRAYGHYANPPPQEDTNL